MKKKKKPKKRNPFAFLLKEPYFKPKKEGDKKKKKVKYKELMFPYE